MAIKILSKSGQYVVENHPGENLLFAGLRHGLNLPYECATGTCGTCRCRVRPGDDVSLTWEEAPGLAYVNPDKNETLMCQAKVNGDCAVRVPAQVEAGDNRPDYFEGRLLGLEKLTGDVISFSVELSQALSFRAGQFVIISSPDVVGGRAYSMTNYSERTKRLDFVVKKKPGGGFSNWLFESARDGASLSVFGPLGKATFDPAEGKNVLCIAGGSGIAGMMAILQHAVDSKHFDKHRGDVFFGVRTEDDIFFAEALSRHANRSPDRLRVTIALSDEMPGERLKARFPSLDFDNGFVHAVASERMAGNYTNLTGFVAGPPLMVDGALRLLVLDARLPASDIRYDKFS